METTHVPLQRRPTYPRAESRSGDSSAEMALALPPGLVFLEQTAAGLRAFLGRRGLDGYSVFQGRGADLHDIDEHLPALDESARWEPHALMTATGEGPAMMPRNGAPRLRPAGFLALDAYGVVVARHYWIDGEGAWHAAFLCGASSVVDYDRLRLELQARRHQHGAAVWQVVRGESYRDGERVPRVAGGEEPLLPEAVRRRIDSDVIRFFSDEVAGLYRSMGVPYRRGVLLHGPPGNGKTSTIRYAGAMLPRIPAMILRPAAGFDDDDFETVVSRWRKQAPAILVVEDLNWLLKSVNLSNFLNLLDGLDSSTDGGLLLLATTNHPDQLDPAINSRPGRFDVVIEIPAPDANLRRQFVHDKLHDLNEAQVDELVAISEGMSFAHLQEVLRLSGLLAIQAGRAARTPADVEEAARTVRRGIEDVERGFAAPLEVPFGLTPRRGRGA